MGRTVVRPLDSVSQIRPWRGGKASRGGLAVRAFFLGRRAPLSCSLGRYAMMRANESRAHMASQCGDVWSQEARLRLFEDVCRWQTTGPTGGQGRAQIMINGGKKKGKVEPATCRTAGLDDPCLDDYSREGRGLWAREM